MLVSLNYTRLVQDQIFNDTFIKGVNAEKVEQRDEEKSSTATREGAVE